MVVVVDKNYKQLMKIKEEVEIKKKE